MKKTILFIGCLFAVFLLYSCSDDKKTSGSPHDPNKPVSVASFLPEFGRIAEKVLITGENFGNDPTQVNVYFEDADGSRNKATIINLSDTKIYCLAPRQANGNSSIIVEIGQQSATATGTFSYSISENVSTVAGMTDNYNTVDGTLAEAAFKDIWGIADLGDNNILVGQAWNGSGVRLISIDDNTVTTVQPGVVVGKFAVNKAKTVAYGVLINSLHTIYKYEKSAGWSASRVGECSGLIPTNVDIWSCALDATEEYLYILANNGKLVRMEIANPSNQEIYLDGAGLLNNGTFNYIAYSHFEDCHYFTQKDRNRIYRLPVGSKELEDVNLVTTPGVEDGYLTEAKFNNLMGLTFDEDGNIYVVQRENHVIRKITLKTGYVSTIVGKAGESGYDDGSPDIARLKDPTDIAYDGNGTFWIGSCWDPTFVRKYAVE